MTRSPRLAFVERIARALPGRPHIKDRRMTNLRPIQAIHHRFEASPEPLARMGCNGNAALAMDLVDLRGDIELRDGLLIPTAIRCCGIWGSSSPIRTVGPPMRSENQRPHFASSVWRCPVIAIASSPW